MMHEFVTYSDGTLVVSSDMRKKENGEEYIIVCFERPTENGFDTIIFELPSYNIVKQDGNYSEKEIEEIFIKILNDILTEKNIIVDVNIIIIL